MTALFIRYIHSLAAARIPRPVSRQRRFALLRADESPGYWQGPAPAVAQQFGMYYVHDVHDGFAMLGYYARGRCIYKRMGRPKGRRGYAGGDPWKDHVRGHCGVVVDGLKAKPVDNGNQGCANQRVRELLAPEVKFCAVQAAGVYPDVDQERALVLTGEYLLDVFRLASGRPRVYDWQVLAFGKAVSTGDWRALVAISAETTRKRFTKPHLSATKLIVHDDKPWSVVVMQDDVARPRGVGVKCSMLGEAGTGVLVAAPPGVAEGKGTAVMATRTKAATVFTVLHEPFEGGPAKAPKTRFEAVGRSGGALGVRVIGPAADDRVLLAFGPAATRKATIAGGGESFTFTAQAWIRIAAGKVVARGGIGAMKLKVTGRPKLTVNGKPAAASVSGGVLSYRAAD